MKILNPAPGPVPRILSVLAMLSLSSLALGTPARADDAGMDTPVDDQGAGTPTAQSEGPVRLARFSLVSGNVTWRADDQATWSGAAQNLPIRQGAQVWAADGGQAEVQFDDGSLLRLGSGALVTLQTLFSDADGEFTEITLNNGVVELRLKHDRSVFQVNTPAASVNADGPAEFRVGTGDRTQIVVRDGNATTESKQGKVSMKSGDYLDLLDGSSPLDLTDPPRPDAFDDWVRGRNAELDGLVNRPAYKRLPPNIALVAGDLDSYGAWTTDVTYGDVWVPRVAPTWRPYFYGHWTWVTPFGWTWVSSEPWGWAPYHYGTWIRVAGGWGWVPGPRMQYWSPAVVHFYDVDHSVAWCPLAPREVHYPSILAIGYRHGDWSLAFSIGGAAVYYPNAHNVCTARPWSSSYVNHVTYINNVTNVTNIRNTTIVNHNTYVMSNGFVPFNARTSGASMATAEAFGGRGSYQPMGRDAGALFARGHLIGAPAAGERSVAGPQRVQPTALAMTPSRTFRQDVRVAPSLLTRPVFRSAIIPEAARTSAPWTHQTPAGFTKQGFQQPGSGALTRQGFQPQPGSGAGTRGLLQQSQPGTSAGSRGFQEPSQPGAGNAARRTIQSGQSQESTGDARARPFDGAQTGSGARTRDPGGSFSTDPRSRAQRARDSLGLHGSPTGGQSGTPGPGTSTGASSPANHGAAGTQPGSGSSGSPRSGTDRSSNPPDWTRTPANGADRRNQAGGTGSSSGSGGLHTLGGPNGTSGRGIDTSPRSTGTGSGSGGYTRIPTGSQNSGSSGSVPGGRSSTGYGGSVPGGRSSSGSGGGYTRDRTGSTGSGSSSTSRDTSGSRGNSSGSKKGDSSDDSKKKDTKDTKDHGH